VITDHFRGEISNKVMCGEKGVNGFRHSCPRRALAEV
jgi:hypothetical protein